METEAVETERNEIKGRLTCSVCNTVFVVSWDGETEKIEYCPACRRANMVNILSTEPYASVLRNPFLCEEQRARLTEQPE